jgi:hypothetical protein
MGDNKCHWKSGDYGPQATVRRHTGACRTISGIAKQLSSRGDEDPICEWMGHHLAELIVAVDNDHVGPVWADARLRLMGVALCFCHISKLSHVLPQLFHGPSTNAKSHPKVALNAL